MNRLVKAGLSMAAVCCLVLTQSCGNSHDVVPLDGINTQTFILNDSTIHDHYIPFGETAPRDTVYHYPINSTLTFAFDAIRDYVVMNGDTLKRKLEDSIAYWGTGNADFNHSTRLIFSRDSIAIHRWGSSIDTLQKHQIVRGLPK